MITTKISQTVEIPIVPPRWYTNFSKNQTKHHQGNIWMFDQILKPMDVEEFGELWVPQMLDTYIPDSKYGFLKGTQTILSLLTGYSDSTIEKYYYRSIVTPLSMKLLLRRTDLLLRLQHAVRIEL